jgi:hypothetical protein
MTIKVEKPKTMLLSVEEARLVSNVIESLAWLPDRGYDTIMSFNRKLKLFIEESK